MKATQRCSDGITWDPTEILCQQRSKVIKSEGEILLSMKHMAGLPWRGWDFTLCKKRGGVNWVHQAPNLEHG